jgi:hypothetical protein
MFTLMVLACVPFMTHAQVPTTEEVKATKEASKASKLAPELMNAAAGKTATPAKNGRLSAEGPVPINSMILLDGAVAIEATATSRDGGEALLRALEGMGLREGKAYKSMVFGYLPIDKLMEVSRLSELRFARPYYKPATNTGSVTSQGDVALRADVARTTYGVNGAGSKIGILSDSYNNLGGEAAGIASGDLPAGGVEVLDEFGGAGGKDEGRAMAEIIHDVAPGAALAFHTALEGIAGFAQGIKDLANVGCKIIVDDIIYFAEPFFQDGLIAQAVDDVVNNNQVTYFSSAGNQARSSYQAGFVNSGQNPFPGAGTPHDFGGGDIFQTITVPANRDLILTLQWDQSSFSASGVGPTTDLDLYMFYNGSLVASSAADNLLSGEPVEITGISNPFGFPINIDVLILNFTGPDPGIIKWVNFGTRNITIEHDTQSPASFGHANAAGAVSVGAAPYFDTPAFNVGLATAIIEPFSSAGGTPTLFDISGNRLPGAGIIRQKPEITSVDGGNNTFFGNDFEPDGRPNFFGTSASAPHAAGVAALMAERSGYTITRNFILKIMENTALDMDDPFTPGFDAGFDFGTGAGFIQANSAVNATNFANLAIVVAPAVQCAGQNTSLSATFDGGLAPFIYAWSTTNGTLSNATNATPTLSNLSVGGATVSLTVTDALNRVLMTTKNLTINPTPTVTATVPPSTENFRADKTIYLGFGTQSLQFTATSSQPGTFAWSPAPGLNNSTIFNPVFSPTAGGQTTFTVTATSTAGCVATADLTITVIDVRCGNTNQNVQICYYGTTQCVTTKAARNFMKIGATIGACGTPNVRLSSEILPTEPEVTTLTLTAGPNPSQGRFTLDITLPAPAPLVVEMHSLSGVMLMQKNFAPGPLRLKEEVSMTSYPSGQYLISAQTDAERKVTRVITVQ